MPICHSPFAVGETCNVLFHGEQHVCKMIRPGHKFAQVQIAGRARQSKVNIQDVSKLEEITPPVVTETSSKKSAPEAPRQPHKTQNTVPVGKYYLDTDEDGNNKIRQGREGMPPRFIAVLPKAYKDEVAVILEALNNGKNR